MMALHFPRFFDDENMKKVFMKAREITIKLRKSLNSKTYMYKYNCRWSYYSCFDH